MELFVPPDLQYGTKLDNGSWTGIMSQLASKVRLDPHVERNNHEDVDNMTQYMH